MPKGLVTLGGWSATGEAINETRGLQSSKMGTQLLEGLRALSPWGTRDSERWHVTIYSLIGRGKQAGMQHKRQQIYSAFCKLAGVH